MLILVSIMYGITHGILYPVLNTIMVGLVRPHDRGKANALFTASFNCGMMVFALTLGFFVDYCNTYLAAFNTCAIMFLIAVLISVIFTLKYGILDLTGETTLDIE